MSDLEKSLRNFIEQHTEESVSEALGGVPDRLRECRRELSEIRQSLERLRDRARRLAEAGLPQIGPPSGVSPESLKNLRDRFELTQEELAALLGVSPVTVTAWETGKSTPRRSSVEKIAEVGQKSQEEVNRELGREPIPDLSADEIRRLREGFGLTQGQLAALIGVSDATVTSWETGQTTPNRQNRRKLAAIRSKPRAELEQELEQAGLAGGAQAELSPDDIRETREKAGLTQRELAERLGVSVNSVSNWETGRASPRRESMGKLVEMREEQG